MDECYCDYDPPIYYHKTNVAMARDIHECGECGSAILPGESYERVRALWDRYEGPKTFNTCAWCRHMREWIEAHIPCFCFAHGGLFALVREELDNNSDADVLRPELEAMFAEVRERPKFSVLQRGTEPC